MLGTGCKAIDTCFQPKDSRKNNRAIFCPLTQAFMRPLGETVRSLILAGLLTKTFNAPMVALSPMRVLSPQPNVTFLFKANQAIDYFCIYNTNIWIIVIDIMRYSFSYLLCCAPA